MTTDRTALKVIATGLRQYLEWNGAIHAEDCPEDDACDCFGKPMNDAANAAYHYLLALLDATPPDVAALDAEIERRHSRCLVTGEPTPDCRYENVDTWCLSCLVTAYQAATRAALAFKSHQVEVLGNQVEEFKRAGVSLAPSLATDALAVGMVLDDQRAVIERSQRVLNAIRKTLGEDGLHAQLEDLPSVVSALTARLAQVEQELDVERLDNDVAHQRYVAAELRLAQVEQERDTREALWHTAVGHRERGLL